MKYKAFTLVEVLLAISIVLIVSGIAITASRPQFNLNQARDSKREGDVTMILNAILRYTSEGTNTVADFGAVPTCPTTAIIGTSGINIAAVLSPTYISTVPTDPSVGNQANTGYNICREGEVITISSPHAQNKNISVKR